MRWSVLVSGRGRPLPFTFGKVETPWLAADLDKFRRELGRLHFSLGSEAVTDYTTTTAMPAVDTKAARVPRVRKNMHRTNFVLGDEATDYRSQAMSMSGQESMKLDDPYVPHRDGSWKEDMSRIKGRKPPL